MTIRGADSQQHLGQIHSNPRRLAFHVALAGKMTPNNELIIFAVVERG